MELTAAEKRDDKRTARVAEVSVPAVYREHGYLVLTLSRHTTHINYLDVQSGKYKQMSGEEFLRAHRRAEDISPYELALNVLGRVSDGSWCSARIKRRLISMLTKENLMQMSERALAREYSRAFRLSKPLTRISGDPLVREGYVTELLKELAERDAGPAAAEQDPVTEVTAEGQPPEDPVEASPTLKEGDPKMTAKKSAVKKAPTEPKKKKEPGESTRSATYPKLAANIKCPYREGSKKAASFNIFRAGGARAEILRKVKNLGATESTAASWINLFRKVKAEGAEVA